jgi:hypothetical protein
MFTSPGVCAATLVFSIHGVLDPPAHCSLASLLDESRLEVLARHHGIKRTKDAERSTNSSPIFLLTAVRGNAAQVLRNPAAMYKVDTDAITLKVKQEFDRPPIFAN